MTATVFRQSYMTQRPSLFTLISYCAIVFSFALIFANRWFTACDGFNGASACWLSHMKQQTITITVRPLSRCCNQRVCFANHFSGILVAWANHRTYRISLFREVARYSRCYEFRSAVTSCEAFTKIHLSRL